MDETVDAADFVDADRTAEGEKLSAEEVVELL